MSTMIYDSVKSSVIQYKKQIKRSETIKDKLIFRYKIIITGAVIVIGILGIIFWHLLTSLLRLPDVKMDKSYIVPMLQNVSNLAVPTVNHAKNLMIGITNFTDSQGVYFQWNSATLIANYDLRTTILSVSDLITKLKKQSQLVFVMASNEIPQPTTRIGIFINQKYKDGYVNDKTKTRYSSLFNLNTGIIHTFNQKDCNLYATYPGTKVNLTLFNIFQIKTVSSIQTTYSLAITSGRTNCFGDSRVEAYSKLSALFDLDLSDQKTRFVNLSTFQVYKLSLQQ